MKDDGGGIDGGSKWTSLLPSWLAAPVDLSRPGTSCDGGFSFVLNPMDESSQSSKACLRLAKLMAERGTSGSFCPSSSSSSSSPSSSSVGMIR
eukprot:CAMPEP_0194060844 /NCGR_PEP_ID=MMETSP0009_2-20130614/72887_1 /TAXON_ID=210454 /ORGANISM="Grammatophora oceanica, Strain CCMP 410" /LENGTH=92 /DNA_ID=CAMNT_0038711901 /DNA_START=128 /DNA_END=406 /DNA_ORIENTATION=+